jgi:superkiller protein 3
MDTAKAFSIAQSAVHAEPARPEIRREVAALSIQKGEYGSALALLAGSSPSTEDGLNDSSESLCLHAIAGLLMKSSSPSDLQTALRQAQRAIMLSPWRARNWQTLAFVRAQAV